MSRQAPRPRNRRRPSHRESWAFAPPVSGAVFPISILNCIVELLINGTWVDISEFVYYRDKIVIKRGKPDEFSTITTSSVTLTLNNRDGRFSPRNQTGIFYPFLGRNTQIRISINSSSISGVPYNGYRFWGEVSAWPPRWDLTGTDVYVPITGAGIWRRFQQNTNIGSTLRRYLMLKTGSLVPVAYWPMEESPDSTQFGNLVSPGNSLGWGTKPTLAANSDFDGSDPIPLISKATLTGLTGSFSGTGLNTYSTPGTYQFVATSTPVNVSVWGAGGGAENGAEGNAGAGGEFSQDTAVAVTVGNIYTLKVGAGGAGGPYGFQVNQDGKDGEDSYFIGDLVTVTGHGGKGGRKSLHTRALGGRGSTSPIHFNGGDGGLALGNGGGGGGSSAGTGAPGNTGSDSAPATNPGANGASAPASGGSGGRGGNGTDNGGVRAGTAPGGGGGAGGHKFSDGTNWRGEAGAPGKVQLSYSAVSAPSTVVTRFIISCPTTGAVNGATLVRTVIASGTLARVEVYYGTGGLLGFRGLDSGSVVKFDTGLIAFSINGTPCILSMELQQSGGNINYALRMLTVGQTLQSTTGTISGTLGAASQVVVNPAATVDDTAIGHVHVQYALDTLTNLGQALIGYGGERAGARFQRFCTESRIASVFVGNVTDTPLMGPQMNKKLSELFQEIEDVDRGQLFEPRDQFGLGYKTRVSLMNQSATLAVDFPSTHLAQVLEPMTDDSAIRNDVTVSRNNGASVNVQLSTTPTQWLVFAQGTTGTLPDGTGPLQYVILSTADASQVAIGDSFTDNFNPGQTFTITVIEPPFVGFNNCHITPNATSAMNSPDTLLQIPRGNLSTLDPPLGVGDYSFSLNANVSTDAQLTNLAQWILNLGTVDEYRYPVVVLDLTRPAVAGLFGQIGLLDIGNYFQITNPPAWLPIGTIKQLALGFTETLGNYDWTIEINAVPESPYEGAGLSW